MTMPHLMNCPHSEDGWCLACVKTMHDEQQAQIERAEAENITEFDAEKFKPKKKREAN